MGKQVRRGRATHTWETEGGETGAYISSLQASNGEDQGKSQACSICLNLTLFEPVTAFIALSSGAFTTPVSGPESSSESLANRYQQSTHVDLHKDRILHDKDIKDKMQNCGAGDHTQTTLATRSTSPPAT